MVSKSALYVNEVTLRDQNLSLKCCQSLELYLYYKEVSIFPKKAVGLCWSKGYKWSDLKV